MNRIEFIKELKRKLHEMELDYNVVDEIVADYEELIMEAVESGEMEEEFISRLGSPKEVARNFKGEKKLKNVDTILVALSPFVATIVFMWLGLSYNLWHPGWLVYLVVPVMGVWTGRKGMSTMEFLTAQSTFIATAFYLIFGFVYNVWHPTWVVFFLIIIFGLFTDTKDKKNMIFATLIILASVAYVIIDLQDITKWDWLVFLVPVIYGTATGKLFQVNGDFPDDPKIKAMVITAIGTPIVYLLIGLIFNLWHPTWLIMFAIPVVAIILFANEDD